VFTAYYNAVERIWRVLFNFARTGRLADGSPMPRAMRGLIVAHYAVVVALCARGRALPSTDIAANASVVGQLLQEQQTLEAIARRFGMLSAISVATTPVWTQVGRFMPVLRQYDPDLAQIIDDNTPHLPDLPLPLITGGVGIALGVGGVVLLILLAQGKL
jgi:hypothetical protein